MLDLFRWIMLRWQSRECVQRREHMAEVMRWADGAREHRLEAERGLQRAMERL